MDILSIIQGTIGDDLAKLNTTLAAQLHTPNELMNRIIDRYLLTKGKQIRPVLIILCARLLDKVTPSTINAAAAIELMHNASLIHDDVIDTSLYRRGEPTINATNDNRIAVLMGDHFVSCALQCAVDTDNMEIVATLSRLGKELAHGEIDQIDNMHAHRLSEEAYFSVIRRKTASLFRACMHVGAVSVNASAADCEALETFGELLGLCFQIKDDIFDYYEDTHIGKPTGNDIREGKITLPLLYAVTHNNDEENSHVRRLIEKTDLTTDEIELLINYAKNNGGIEYAYEQMQRIRQEAVAAIEPYAQHDVYNTLVTILDYTIGRNK